MFVSGFTVKSECNFPFVRVTETSRKGTVVTVPVGLNFMCLFCLLQCSKNVFKLSSPSVQIINMSYIYIYIYIQFSKIYIN